MAKIKSAVFKVGAMVCSLALLLGVSSAGAACAIAYHQPKVPAGMEKFRKV